MGCTVGGARASIHPRKHHPPSPAPPPPFPAPPPRSNPSCDRGRPAGSAAGSRSSALGPPSHPGRHKRPAGHPHSEPVIALLRPLRTQFPSLLPRGNLQGMQTACGGCQCDVWHRASRDLCILTHVSPRRPGVGRVVHATGALSRWHTVVRLSCGRAAFPPFVFATRAAAASCVDPAFRFGGSGIPSVGEMERTRALRMACVCTHRYVVRCVAHMPPPGWLPGCAHPTARAPATRPSQPVGFAHRCRTSCLALSRAAGSRFSLLGSRLLRRCG